MNKVFWLVVAVCAMGLMMACKNGTVAEGKVLDSLIANHGVVGTFHEGLAYVKIDRKIGYVDTTGRLVISPQFESEKYGFHDGGYSERFTFTGKECDEEIWGEVCMADNSTAWQSERVHFALALENC